MTGAARPVRAIMEERVAVVGEIARLNAEALRHRQLAGGAEIELAALQGERELAAVRERADALALEGAARERRLLALDEQLARLDRELALA